jgi:ribonuclease HI
LSSGRHRTELHSGSFSTTNNRMDLTAVIEALNALKGAGEVELFTDSE